MSDRSEAALSEMLDAIGIVKSGALSLEKGFISLEKSPRGDTLPMEATVMDELHSAIDRLKIMESLLIGDLKKHLPDPKNRVVELPTGGAVQINTSVPRKTWDKDVLIGVVIEKVIEESIDPETGAIDRPISQMLRRVLDFVSFSNFKVTELKQVGVNPDNYCETGTVKSSAQYRR